ncbi:1,2-phenylacetyl-CoA epoxidase subunit PaaD [Streptomyces sp. DSM 44915]|uniref:1,2-phenylacetyl-CoA epoxidase subunit PaaD n=1 Tax=Streptomyces chisholmiae TaxID=3075540 RepID=A0ABU2JQY2_9ACTN|nr:1,2-phenylacetyl-CoA epoxidase subunit PaaD [Streptomyces sp. DSM 44915]MDT0267390.1 1,2-phenylacetyl-CoA epoxidase subunit PaaD [Streptomyces sp. DSM 44915]
MAEETAEEAAWRVAGSVPDPELPVVTVAELGMVRGVACDGAGGVVVRLTPTYGGCPAVAEIRAGVAAALRAAGFDPVEVVTVLAPPWSSEWISPAGRRKLASAGIAPPGRAAGGGPVPLTLSAPRRVVVCPRCGADDTEPWSRFGAAACTELWRCLGCREPFERVREV